ncbi:MAG: type I-U CRISPR-associated helicase/endonuclease Cas3, partial [Betaproteobacteria bacterium]|nr:type I-U CRISPR-associated helicase/endonuclease Cas3 [Betaproteobacteria bacterium]
MTIRHEQLEAGKFFTSSFLALTGYPPMPWQARLFGTHFVSGSLPEAVSIPTGLGKTAVMAVWLIGFAWQMRNQAAPSLPRRLVYVVDRRAVVDQSTIFAEKLREALATPAANELRTALGFTEDQKLAISTLRGQFVDNREWLENPSRPAIIVGTVDMIGSRLLFEGYGVSRRMRPYHAGLLGADSLVMLDEAHLVPPFEALLATIASGPHVYGAHTKEDRKRIPEFKVLPLSATNRNSGADVFALEAQDYDDPADEGAKRTRKRLDAVKRLRIETAGTRNLPQAIAERAWEVSGEGVNDVRCLIYCDRRDDAQRAFDDLLDRLIRRAKTEMRKAKGESKEQHEVRVSVAVQERIELFVGARRVCERQQAQKRLEALGFLADSKSNLGSATYLVATSAGEVGVDLDADHLVCDLVAWERMVQRFGRVNRRGRVSADILIVAPPPEAPKTKLPDKLQIAALSDPSKPVKPKKPGKKATTEEYGAYSQAISRFNREEADYKEALKLFKDKQKRQQKAEDNYQEALAKYREDWAPTILYKERISLLERLNGDASPRALLNLLANTVADTGFAHAIQACSTAVPLRPALSRPL